MDSKDHPVVQQGIKAAEVISNVSWFNNFSDEVWYPDHVKYLQIPYKEDWEAEKQQVYYPVHITPEYEASSDVKKVLSDVSNFCAFAVYWHEKLVLFIFFLWKIFFAEYRRFRYVLRNKQTFQPAFDF